MRIDHITLAGPDLEVMRSAFRDHGLEPEYGGPHSNGITHMCWLGFDDGSYLELVSTLQPGRGVPLWSDHVAPADGCSAWTIGSDHLTADVELFRRAGIEMREPIEVRRTRPDGRVGAWDLACPAGPQPGGTLPFLIQDHTPRSVRVTPSPSVAASVGGLTGLTHVALAVRDPDRIEAAFRALFGCPAPLVSEEPEWKAQFRRFPDTPVILCIPSSAESPVARHLDRYQQTPWAFFFGSCDLPSSRGRYQLEAPVRLAGLDLCWLSLPQVPVARAGVVAAEL